MTLIPCFSPKLRSSGSQMKLRTHWALTVRIRGRGQGRGGAMYLKSGGRSRFVVVSGANSRHAETVSAPVGGSGTTTIAVGAGIFPDPSDLVSRPEPLKILLGCWRRGTALPGSAGPADGNLSGSWFVDSAAGNRCRPGEPLSRAKNRRNSCKCFCPQGINFGKACTISPIDLLF
jgi:hypothetical protein